MPFHKVIGRASTRAAPTSRAVAGRAAAGTIPTIRTLVTADFVIPAVGADVVVDVQNPSIFWIDQVIFIADRGAPNPPVTDEPFGVGSWMMVVGGNPSPKSA